jgi:hypothetical protein
VPIGIYLVFDTVAVALQLLFARFIVTYVHKAYGLVVCAALGLALLATIRRFRRTAGVGMAVCAAYFSLVALAASFAFAFILWPRASLVVALLSGGILVPVVALIGTGVQREWGMLLFLVVELSVAIWSTLLAVALKRPRRKKRLSEVSEPATSEAQVSAALEELRSTRQSNATL